MPDESQQSNPSSRESVDREPSSERQAFIRNTLARFGTAAVGIPILLYLMFLAPPWGFELLVVTAVTRASYELARITLPGSRAQSVYGMLAAPALMLTILHAPSRDAAMAGMLVLTSFGLVMGLQHPQPHEAAGARTAWLVAGPLYLGGMLGMLARLHQLSQGGEWVTLAMMLAWMSDTGAYFAGRFFGRTKLAPRVSPAKTVEGSAGGLAAAVLGAVIAHFTFLSSLPLLNAVVLGVVGGGLGQVGDLIESLIKRSSNVKDSGQILPGHGGMLDRVDALMFTSTTCLLYRLWFAP